MQVKAFWLEPTQLYRHSLRRYAGDEKCALKPYGMDCHDVRVPLGLIEAPEHPVSYGAPAEGDDDPDAWKADRITRKDERWPSACACGYVFKESDSWRVDYDKQYQAIGGPHDGSMFTLRDAPAGAMWDATWYHDSEWATGPDGISLVVKLPNGHDWLVDQEASNCTRTQYGPGEYLGGDGQMHQANKMWKGRTHYCWIRHGDPKTGNVHVDKNGDTCAAGAGSILSGSYHGFLHNGYLTD